MDKVVLFDFDGTLVKGDSTKHAYRSLFSSRLSFIMGYYVVHILGLLVLISSGKDCIIRESRRLVLASKYCELEKSDFIKQAQRSKFDQVWRCAKSYVDNGYRLIIVSAGYREIISFIIGDDLEYKLIANSLFDKKPEVINYENKVTRLNLEFKSNYLVKAAYGNTKGDIPMLQLAEKAFWVDENGEISEFCN